MSKRVLDVGQCVPDHAAIRRLVVTNFDAQVVQTHGHDDTLQELEQGEFELVLINRKLDRDYSDGIEILKAIKADANHCDVNVMLITNYADHQDLAVQAGGVRGFGKDSLSSRETRDLLAKYLS